MSHLIRDEHNFFHQSKFPGEGSAPTGPVCASVRMCECVCPLASCLLLKEAVMPQINTVLPLHVLCSANKGVEKKKQFQIVEIN